MKKKNENIKLELPEKASLFVQLEAMAIEEVNGYNIASKYKSNCSYENVDNFETAMLLFVAHLKDLAVRTEKDVSEICMIAEQLAETGATEMVEKE